MDDPPGHDTSASPKNQHEGNSKEESPSADEMFLLPGGGTRRGATWKAHKSGTPVSPYGNVRQPLDSFMRPMRVVTCVLPLQPVRVMSRRLLITHGRASASCWWRGVRRMLTRHKAARRLGIAGAASSVPPTVGTFALAPAFTGAGARHMV